MYWHALKRIYFDVVILAAKRQRAALWSWRARIKRNIVLLTMRAGTLNLPYDISYLSLSFCSKRNNSSVGLLSETLKKVGWWCHRRRAVVMTRGRRLLSSWWPWIGLVWLSSRKAFLDERHTGIKKGLCCGSVQINSSVWICVIKHRGRERMRYKETQEKERDFFMEDLQDVYPADLKELKCSSL